jgi:preprotein translocase subunit SecD
MTVCLRRATVLSMAWALLSCLALAAVGPSWAVDPANKTQRAAPNAPSTDNAFEGSFHVLLEVDTDYAVKEELQNLVDRVRITLRKARIAYLDLGIENDRLWVTIRDPDRTDEAKELLAKTTPVVRSDPSMPNRIFIGYDDAFMSVIREASIKRAILTARANMEDVLDGRQPSLQRIGKTNRFVIQFPEGFDPNKGRRLRRLFPRIRPVQFHFLERTVPSDQVQEFQPQPDTRLLSPGPDSSITGEKPNYVVRRRMLFSSTDVLDARVMFRENGTPEMHLNLSFSRNWKFLMETGRRVAIVSGEMVLAAPVIQGPIHGNTIVIGGQLSLVDAQFLAKIILRGGFPAPLDILREWTVPTGFEAQTISSGPKG